jgi:2-methylcitrate dehydratase PrpD
MVRYVPDEALSKLLPVRVAVVEVTLSDGTQLSDRVDAVRGTPRNPMSRAEIVDKARDLIGPVSGTARAGALIDAVLTLDTLTDIRALRPLLQRQA